VVVVYLLNLLIHYTVELKLNKILSLSLLPAVLQLQH